MKRTVRSIGGDIAKKWTVTCRFHEIDSGVKPHVSAVTSLFFCCVVTKVGIVEIIIFPVVWCLPNASPSVDQDLLKSAIQRSKGEVVTQVPFAKNTRAISIGLKGVGQCGLATTQQRPSQNSVPDPRPTRITSRH